MTNNVTMNISLIFIFNHKKEGYFVIGFVKLTLPWISRISSGVMFRKQDTVLFKSDVLRTDGSAVVMPLYEALDLKAPILLRTNSRSISSEQSS